ncbi:PilZ domain-containing protein [Terriglobus roseus]|uniref:PilZ domain-containing protein n=2 Tax=Terriglobus roseus TaxID=392734 RepID=A0A1H4TU75_9BACT|nr:PilZ domain-containing protein [Terriglobus roseus]
MFSMPPVSIPPKPLSDATNPMRNAVRFPLRLNVHIDTDNGPVEAVTEDISASGVQFVMPWAPPINSRLAWTLVLPGEIMGSPDDVTVSCVGRVVWHRPGIVGKQVGVVIDGYRIGELARG